MNGMDNKVYGVWAVRGGGSVFGHAEAWCKHYGAPIEFDSKSEAQKYAAELNKRRLIAATASVKSSMSRARSGFRWSVPLMIRCRLSDVPRICPKTTCLTLS